MTGLPHSYLKAALELLWGRSCYYKETRDQLLQIFSKHWTGLIRFHVMLPQDHEHPTRPTPNPQPTSHFFWTNLQLSSHETKPLIYIYWGALLAWPLIASRGVWSQTKESWDAYQVSWKELNPESSQRGLDPCCLDVKWSMRIGENLDIQKTDNRAGGCDQQDNECKGTLRTGLSSERPCSLLVLASLHAKT